MSQKPFHFIGKAPFSKSLLNRALIIKSWYPDFIIHGSSLCDDILAMDSAVKKLCQLGLNSSACSSDFQLGGNNSFHEDNSGNKISEPALQKQKENFDCGLSGTAFRFLALRLSREKGKFVLNSDTALFKRPLEEAFSLLSQLSVLIEKTKQSYIISSKGWKLQGDCVYVPSKITSQWASALLLNSWNLDQDLYFVFNSSAVSYPYFKMTLDFVRSLGLIVQHQGDEFFISKGQNLKVKEYHPEQDKSCLFALACFAVLKGQAVFLDWGAESLQADHIFMDILKSMAVPVELRKGQPVKPFDFSHKPTAHISTNSPSVNSSSKNKYSSSIRHSHKHVPVKAGNGNLQARQGKAKQIQLIISKCDHLKALDINLKGQPDLFPMLAILCARAEGLSVLREVSHVVFKESNRAKKIKELLEKCGIQVKIQKNDFVIYGQKKWTHKIHPFEFDTEQDHRLVMTGELIAGIGVPIILKGKEAVNKSFPEFYSLIQS